MGIYKNKKRNVELKNMKNNIKNYFPELRSNIGKMYISDYDVLDELWTEYTYIACMNNRGVYTTYVITVYPEDKTWAVKQDLFDAVCFNEYKFKEFSYKENKLLNSIIKILTEITEE